MTHGEETLVLITGFDESALDFFISDDSAAELINATSDSVYVKLHASEAITEEIR